MNKLKWVYRYTFVGILLALCLVWCGYCVVTVIQLDAKVHSLEFIDLAVNLSPEAITLLERLETFQSYMITAIILSAVGILGIVAMTLWQKHGEAIKAKLAAPKSPKAPKATKTKKAETEPIAPVSSCGFCTNCGQRYDEVPEYCTVCGAKIEHSN